MLYVSTWNNSKTFPDLPDPPSLKLNRKTCGTVFDTNFRDCLIPVDACRWLKNIDFPEIKESNIKTQLLQLFNCKSKKWPKITFFITFQNFSEIPPHVYYSSKTWPKREVRHSKVIYGFQTIAAFISNKKIISLCGNLHHAKT